MKINMKTRLLFIFLLSIFLQGFAQSPREIFQKNRPAVCLVTYFKNVASQSQIGSFTKIKQNRIGVIVDPQGLVMVSSDVYPISLDIVSGGGSSYFYSGEPSDFKIKLFDDREFDAKFIGKDDLSQVAFIRITDENSGPLPYIEFSDTDDIQIGQGVFLLELLGESEKFQPLFTPMTINAILINPRKRFLINGSSISLSAGGLVLSQSGKAIGITLKSEEAYSFNNQMDLGEYQQNLIEIAPTEWFKKLIKNPPLVTKETYQGKSWLGIRMQALTPELKSYWDLNEAGGVIIDQVYAESPADRAGLRTRDIITAFNDKKLKITSDEELNQLRELITQQAPGSKIKLAVTRDGKVIEKEVKLTAAPESVDRADKFQLVNLGLEVRELTRDILYDYNLPLGTNGVYVYQVDRAAPAGLAGMPIGGIITEVDNQPIKNLKSFEQTINKILKDNPEKIMFRVQVRKTTLFVFVENK